MRPAPGSHGASEGAGGRREERSRNAGTEKERPTKTRLRRNNKGTFLQTQQKWTVLTNAYEEVNMKTP